MELHALTKITTKTKRRLGQGHGSGRVKTAGRGTKGQNARNGVPLWFEGGAVSLIKRLPFRRGKGRNKVYKKKPIAIPLVALNIFKAKEIIDQKALITKHIVDEADAKLYGIKILGNGELKIPVVVRLPISKSAAKKIKKAGGTVEAA